MSEVTVGYQECESASRAAERISFAKLMNTFKLTLHEKGLPQYH